MDVGCSLRVFWSLNHDLITSLGISHTPIIQKSTPTCAGVTVWGRTHMPIHSISRCYNTFYTYIMDVGCSPRGLEPQPWPYNITRAQPYPNHPKIHPQPGQVRQCEGASIYPCTANQGAQRLCIHIIWMWDAAWSLLQHQPWHLNIILARPYPNFSKFGPHPTQVLQCKNAHMCPFTAYQDA